MEEQILLPKELPTRQFLDRFLSSFSQVIASPDLAHVYISHARLMEFSVLAEERAESRARYVKISAMPDAKGKRKVKLSLFVLGRALPLEILRWRVQYSL
jgi:hypothetical protein